MEANRAPLRPLDATYLLRSVRFVALFLVLTATASAQEGRPTEARLPLAPDTAAACAGQGDAASALGRNVEEHATVALAARRTAVGYWNPLARASARIDASNADYTGCWLDVTVEVRAFQHACLMVSSVTLMAGDRSLATASDRLVPAGTTRHVTLRAQLPDVHAWSASPVFVDLRLQRVPAGCGG